jgi:hypothetical protein
MTGITVNKWENLPDPRHPAAPRGPACHVELTQDAWEHIERDHIRAVSERDLWAEWLGLKAVGSCGSDACKPPTDEPVPCPADQACKRVGCAVRAAMERPLVMLHRRGPETASYAWPMWALVLPNGAVAHVQPRKGKTAVVQTCYFPDEVARGRPHGQRAWVTIELWVKRHAMLSSSGFWVLPEPSHRVPVRDWKTGMKWIHHHIRFVTPPEWGFCRQTHSQVWHWSPRNLKPWMLPNLHGVTDASSERNMCHPLPRPPVSGGEKDNCHD